MAETTQTSTSEEAEPVGKPDVLPIVRDTRFVRLAADDVIVVHRERDVQISLLAEGPEPTSQALPGKRTNGFSVQDVELKHSYTEIGRVGIPSGKAFSMAMNLIEAAVEGGNIPIKFFRERFLAMLEEHKAIEDRQDAARAKSGNS